ncbi:MAG: restriction endonuclease [Candidatus Competibacter sp.]|nr:restriction endonuclease [Candidatus Competibacter sp.]
MMEREEESEKAEDFEKGQTRMIEIILGDVIKPRREKAIPIEFPDLPYIGLEHVAAHTMQLTGYSRSGNMVSTANRFYQGDVLYSRLRPYLNKVIEASFNGLCSSEFIVFPPSKFLNSSFLKYRLNSADFVAFAFSLNAGDRPRVDFNQISSFKFVLPSSLSQTRIVQKLEELLSDLDAGVAELKAAQKKLTQYRQSLLKAAVEGALTAEWRAERAKRGEPLETGAQLLERILAERRRRWEEKQLAKLKEQGKTPPKDWRDKYPEPVKPNTADLPELPEGWVWATIDQLAVLIRNGLSQKPNPEPVGYPILRINAVRSMAINLDEVRYLPLNVEDAKDYFIDQGDLLVTRYNGSVELLGVFGLVREVKSPILHPDKLIRIKLAFQKILSEWVEICAAIGKSREHIVSRVKTTAGQTGISGLDIKKMPVPLAPIQEQETAINKFRTVWPEIVRQNEAIELSLKQSSAQRQNILKAAFSGRLVPQDPNDEPASVLLERICAERAVRESGGRRRGRKTKEDAA